jgi:hypothetical protein
MSAYGMKPHFIDQAGYMRWRKQWRIVHADISKNIRNQKRVCKEAQRAGSGFQAYGAVAGG